jgi:nucleotide-binding universal stress UspA family protein
MAFGNRWQAWPRTGVHGSGMKRAMIRNILVPIDFSEMSIHSIATAKRLAKRFDAKMHLVHVNQLANQAAFMAEQLRMVAQRTGSFPLEQRPLVASAAPYHEICRLASELPVDLIVMATHGYTGLSHVFLGSTAERVVQHSPCPVFVVRQKKQQSKTAQPLSIKTILVPVDFSDCSLEGLHYAIRFANEFRAKLILLHATHLGYIYSRDGMVPFDVRDLQEAARESAEQQMRELVRTIESGALKVETTLTSASAVVDICSFAKDYEIDLIITSTHGFSGLRHALIGSVAERVVRHAPCSVLVVPSHPQSRRAILAEALARTTSQSPRQKAQSRKSSRGKAPTKRHRKLETHAFSKRC